jgi:hypothetical protein
VEYITDLNIDFFDQLTILLRFFDIRSVLDKMEEMSQSFIEQGRLEAIPLIGLDSPDIVRVL